MLKKRGQRLFLFISPHTGGGQPLLLLLIQKNKDKRIVVDSLEEDEDEKEQSSFRCLKCTGCNEDDVCLRTGVPPPFWSRREDLPAWVLDEWMEGLIC